MHIDLRGFSYPLNPLIRKHEWRLERLLALCGKTQQKITDKQQQLAQFNLALEDLSQQHASTSMMIDMQQRQNYVLYAGQLQGKRQEVTQYLDKLYAHQRKLKSEYANVKNKLDALNEHKKKCKKEFVFTSLQKVYKEADLSWNARTSWLTDQAGCGRSAS